jgi:hypothetical protein
MYEIFRLWLQVKRTQAECVVMKRWNCRIKLFLTLTVQLILLEG